MREGGNAYGDRLEHQRHGPQPRRLAGYAAPVGDSRRGRPARHQVRLRRGPVRRLHRPSRRRRRAQLHDHRLGEAEGKQVVTIEGLDPAGQPPGAGRLARDERAAMRLLPGGPDHAGLRPARRATRTPTRPGHPRRHARATSAAAAATSASSPRSASPPRECEPCCTSESMLGRSRPVSGRRSSQNVSRRVPAEGPRRRLRRGAQVLPLDQAPPAAITTGGAGHAERHRQRSARLRRHRPGRHRHHRRPPLRDGHRRRAPACRWSSPTRWRPTGRA